MTEDGLRDWFLRLNFRPEWVDAYLAEKRLSAEELAAAQRKQELTDQARRLGIPPEYYLAQFEQQETQDNG